MDPAPEPARPWTWWWILASTAIVALVSLAAQVAAVVAVAVWKVATTPGFDAGTWGASVQSDGVVLSAATVTAAAVCIPIVRWLTGRREPAPWRFLGFRPVGWREILLACGAAGLFIAISDPLNVWLGRPLVPPFMLKAYTTVRLPALLFLAVAIAAPLTEELVFRGFLFGALQARGIRPGITIGATSLLFALTHTQYDAWDMSLVFAMGVLFAGARSGFDSIIPPMAMHAFVNTVAFVETALIART